MSRHLQESKLKGRREDLLADCDVTGVMSEMPGVEEEIVVYRVEGAPGVTSP